MAHNRGSYAPSTRIQTVSFDLFPFILTADPDPWKDKRPSTLLFFFRFSFLIIFVSFATFPLLSPLMI